MDTETFQSLFPKKDSKKKRKKKRGKMRGGANPGVAEDKKAPVNATDTATNDTATDSTLGGSASVVSAASARSSKSSSSSKGKLVVIPGDPVGDPFTTTLKGGGQPTPTQSEQVRTSYRSRVGEEQFQLTKAIALNIDRLNTTMEIVQRNVKHLHASLNQVRAAVATVQRDNKATDQKINVMAKDINWLWKTIDAPSDTSSDDDEEGDETLSELGLQYETAKRRYREKKALERLPPPFYPKY